MTIKRIVLLALFVYGLSAAAVLFIGFFFGDPNPNFDSAQSLLQLNAAAQDGIADRTNEKVDQVAKSEPNEQAPDKVAPPVESNTQAAAPSNNSTPSSNTPAPEPQPDPPAAACGQGGTCTAAEVASHNTQSNCWVSMGSKAYNVTAYVNAHPGGAGAFDGSTCGKDITAQMQGTASSTSLGGKKKNHPQSAYGTLNSYYVADISG